MMSIGLTLDPAPIAGSVTVPAGTETKIDTEKEIAIETAHAIMIEVIAAVVAAAVVGIETTTGTDTEG